MLGLSRVPPTVLLPINRVVRAVLEQAEGLAQDDIMLVGACCRDVLHSALGHTFPTTATSDLDLALGLSSWRAFDALASAFTPISNTGIRFRIADVDVDLLPFGGVEDPPGQVDPPTRGESMSVWAFDEIFAASLELPLAPDLTIRLPTVAGYAGAKMGAWLDRSVNFEVKDAPDLALVLFWYFDSPEVRDRLYDTPEGINILLQYDADRDLAAAHLLGVDVATTIKQDRLVELLGRWPGNAELLIRELLVRGSPPSISDRNRRQEILEALTSGLDHSVE